MAGASNVAPLRPENITLVALPEGVVIEHKTPGGSRRENFCSPFQIVMVLLNRFTHCTKSAAWRACNQSLLTISVRLWCSPSRLALFCW